MHQVAGSLSEESGVVADDDEGEAERRRLSRGIDVSDRGSAGHASGCGGAEQLICQLSEPRMTRFQSAGQGQIGCAEEGRVEPGQGKVVVEVLEGAEGFELDSSQDVVLSFTKMAFLLAPPGASAGISAKTPSPRGMETS
ncbi:MAG: hypothetical protein H0T54_06735 [Geodermatophilaceae bacterium]|nr:hypothetical protein [Geodermatophilaceae bacterium]